MLHNVFRLCFHLVFAEVLFDFDAKEDDELSLRKGEIVEVLFQRYGGWWKGSLNGKVGTFPSNFVELEEKANKEPGELKVTY